MKAHQLRALLPRPEAIFHHAIPNLARGAVLGDLLEEVVVRVEEKTQARAEVVDIKPTTARPLDIFDAVVERERQFLERGGAGLANVISADRNRVEARREFRSEFKCV